LGVVKLLGESSIGAGVRRVEALVGADAYKFLAREHVLLNTLTEIVKGARKEELPERISELVTRLRESEKDLAALRSAQALSESSEIAKSARLIGGISLIVKQLPDGVLGEDLRAISLDIRNKITDSVVVLVSVVESKPVLVVAVSEGARKRGVKAGALVKIGSVALGGGGGGKDDFAQGGGVMPSEIDSAFADIVAALPNE
jgi:alanyl-tRNA synthetase